MNLLMGIMPAIVERTKTCPSRNSALSGAQYYKEILETDNQNRFREVARMDKPTFIKLLIYLKPNLTSSTKICYGQRVMIFLYTISGKTNRDAQERWQHSGDTISKIIHEVAKSLIIIQKEFVFMDVNPSTSARILNNSKFFPYFANCIGAIDGTHIPAVVQNENNSAFRNRKCYVSQNVLAACDFNMVITYTLAGWEGSAHDGRVLSDAMEKGFPVRVGKYYLGDAGYSLTKNVLTPYRGTRYHLRE